MSENRLSAWAFHGGVRDSRDVKLSIRNIEKERLRLETIVNERTAEIMEQTGNHEEARDGIDLALVVIYPQKNVIEYSGANMPLWLF